MIDYNHASNPQILLPINLAGDKNVSDFAKLLYVQIHIDYTQYRFCVKTNKEFSAIFGKDPHTVSRSISQLVNGGYVMSSISATLGNSRVLYPNF